MSAPTIDALPALPHFPSARGLPDQPGVFIPQFLAFLTALGTFGDQANALAAYLDALSLSGGGTVITGNFAPFSLTVTNEPDASYTLSGIDIWAHRRFTNAGAVTLNVNTLHSFDVGDRCRFTQAGAGIVTMTTSGVTLNSRGGVLTSAGQFAVWELECVGANEFDVLGDVG
jgi:hypothetical protein